MVNRSVRNVLAQIGTKFKFWAYMYISAWIIHRLVVAIFYHIIFSECYGGGCGLTERLLSFLEPFSTLFYHVIFRECHMGGCDSIERLLSFLDPFGPLVLLAFVSYVFFLNLVFVRQYTTAFLCLTGAVTGIGAIIIYPSQIDYISQEIVDEMFPALATLAGGWVGFSVWILMYLILFAALFFLTTVTYAFGRRITGMVQRA